MYWCVWSVLEIQTLNSGYIVLQGVRHETRAIFPQLLENYTCRSEGGEQIFSELVLDLTDFGNTALCHPPVTFVKTKQRKLVITVHTN